MRKHVREVPDANAWFDPEIIVATVVSHRPRVVVTATVQPFNLYAADAEVTANVAWSGLSVIASVVQGAANEQPWLRCMQVLWAVLSPDTAPVEGEFGPKRWASARLWLPDVEGEREEKIIVELRREGWGAVVNWPSGPRSDIFAAIPPDLRQLDVGSLLVEMTSRLVFGKRWL